MLAESRTGDFLRDIFDGILTGIVAFDRDLRLLEANPTWMGFVERYSGTDPKKVVPGISLAELAPEIARTLEPLFRRAIAGETVRLTGVQMEAMGTTSYWDVVISPLIHDGEIAGLFEVATDATERVKAGIAAREHADQFQSIFDSTSDAVIITDLESGRVVEANPACCRLHGYTREEFLGIDPVKFIHPDSLPLFAEFMAATRAGSTFRCRAMDVRKDGSSFPVEVFGSALAHVGKPHAVAVVRDITDQLATEERAALRRAELERMVDERTHELSALLDLARSASSTLDLETLLGVILDQLRQLADYTGAGVSLIEGDRLVQFVARRAADPEYVSTRIVTPVDPDSPVWQKLNSGVPVIIRDVFAHEPLADAFRATVGPLISRELAHIRSWLAVPLQVDGRTFGIVTLSRKEPNAIAGRDVQIVEAVAAQVGIAIENARLFAASEEKSRELAALLDASQAVLSSLDSQGVLERLLVQLRLVVEYDGCSILTEVDDKELAIVASRAAPHLPQRRARGMKFGKAQSGVIWEAVTRGENVIVPDVRGEGPFAEAYRCGVGDNLDTVFAEVTSFLAVPLADKDRVFGMLTLSRNELNYFTDHHAELAAGLANQAAIALSNARLFEEAGRRAREMEALSRVAASLTFDQPREETLNLLAQRVIDATDAVACSITLLGPEHQYRMSGSAGLPPDFTQKIAEAVRKGAPSASHQAVERQSRLILRNARAMGLNDERFAAARDAFATAEWDTIVLTPLIYAGRALGTVEAYYRPGEEPDERQVLFLGAIADQTAVAVENARLFAETRQRLRAAEALRRVASNLTFDQSIESTLDVLAESVVSATRAVASTVVLVDSDDESVRSIGTFGLPSGYREGMREAWQSGGRSESMYVYHTQKPQVFQNVRERHRSYGSQSPLNRLMGAIAWDTIASVPIVFRGRSRGAVNGFYLPGDEPDSDEIMLLRSMADQAAVGVENARLFAEAEKRVREMEALYRADEQLHSSLHLDVVLQALVDTAVDIIGADKSLLVVADERTGRLRIQASRGFDDATLEIAHQSLQSLDAASLQLRRDPIIVNDALNDTRSIRAVTDAAGIGAYVDVPVDANGRVFGVFNVSFNEPRVFQPSDTRLYVALSKRAGLAIGNARLYERSQQAASLEERQRLARELHDSVSQALYGIALGAKTARTLLDRDPTLVVDPLDYVLSLAEAGLAELRAMIFELRPESLETEGIVAAFDKQFAALRARHGVEVVANLGDEPEVGIDVKEAVYRIGQEAMHNTAKHARATRVTVTLEQDASEIVLTISDDGRGFDPEGEFPGHLGLKSMTERARNVGGRLTIESAEGSGTRIRVAVPTGQQSVVEQ